MISRFLLRVFIGAAVATAWAANEGLTQSSSDLRSDRVVVNRLHQSILEADQRGDFEAAAKSAEACVAILRSAQFGARVATDGGFCLNYLRNALIHGKGTPRDEGRAFNLLKEGVAADPDGDWAFQLAEAYLDGQGTLRDAVEAAIAVWRVDHGVWSVYGPNWGMCTVCDDASARRRKAALRDRLERELTSEDGMRATAAEAGRFPEISKRVTRRNVQITMASSALLVLLLAAIWFCVRSSRA